MVFCASHSAKYVVKRFSGGSVYTTVVQITRRSQLHCRSHLFELHGPNYTIRCVIWMFFLKKYFAFIFYITVICVWLFVLTHVTHVLSHCCRITQFLSEGQNCKVLIFSCDPLLQLCARLFTYDLKSNQFLMQFNDWPIVDKQPKQNDKCKGRRIPTANSCQPLFCFSCGLSIFQKSLAS